MQSINLKEELQRTQTAMNQQYVVQQAVDILNEENIRENAIRRRLKNTPGNSADLLSDRLDASQMFDKQAIEQICTRFRLRFLDSNLFKGDVPAEAIRKVKRLEASTGMKFERFKIIATAERFQLKDSTKDPMLMAQLPNGKFYFIHQWGTDLQWYQEILKYPFRHMGTLTLSSVVLGALVALLVPEQFDLQQAEFFYRFFMFSMSSALFLTLTIIAGILYSKDFSENVWNSQFFR